MHSVIGNELIEICFFFLALMHCDSYQRVPWELWAYKLIFAVLQYSSASQDQSEDIVLTSEIMSP